MFNVTKKKLVFFVMTTVLVTLMCILVSIYNIFRTLIIDDYTTKLSHFTTQDAVRLSAHLSFLSSNMDNICTELDLENEMNSSKVPNYITIKIANTVKYSPYISSVYVYQSDKLIPYFPINSKYAKPSKAMSKILNQSPQSDGWLINTAQNSSKRANVLYYVKSISDKTQIIFQINSDDIFKIFNSDTPFCNKTETIIFSADKKCLSKVKNITSVISKNMLKNAMAQKYSSPVCKRGKIIYTQHVPQTKFYICSVTKSSYINQKMSFLMSTLIVIYIAAILLCRFFTLKLGNEITDALGKIHNDMEHYYG